MVKRKLEEMEDALDPWQIVVDGTAYHLPMDANAPLSIPSLLHPYLTQLQRLPRRLRPIPQPWTEYRLLALSAVTGWSLRWSLTEQEAGQQRIHPRSQKVYRACRQLVDAGLWETERVSLSRFRLVLVRLSPLGRLLLRALELTPVESEWDRHERLHRGGERGQEKHLAAIAAFAHHARCWSYDTTVCPAIDGAAEPDLRLHWPPSNQTIDVEVQRRGGDPFRRADKWRNLDRLQGFVAFCTVTPEQRERYVREIRRVGIRRILATDLQTLHRHDPDDLWVTRFNMEID